MERTEILELMSTLKLFGMRAAGACPRAAQSADPGDEVMASGIKRRHEPPRIVGDLLSAEIAEKQARSIKYQLAIAKLPLAKSLPRRRPGTSSSTSPARRSTRRSSATPAFAGAGSGKRKVHCRAAQRRPDRRHRAGDMMHHLTILLERHTFLSRVG